MGEGQITETAHLREEKLRPQASIKAKIQFLIDLHACSLSFSYKQDTIFNIPLRWNLKINVASGLFTNQSAYKDQLTWKPVMTGTAPQGKPGSFFRLPQGTLSSS